MIAAKLSTFIINERILAEAKKKKREGIKVYEGFLKAIVEIRKKNWEKVKELGSENKYAILVYDRICTTGIICCFKNYKICSVKYLAFM